MALSRSNLVSNGQEANPDMPRLLMDSVRERSHACRMAPVSYSIDLYNNSCMKLQAQWLSVATATQQPHGNKENKQVARAEVIN
jgi:hypothetical protein